MSVLGAVLAANEQLPEDVGKAGPIGLLLIVGLLVAVLLLGRSMARHLRRVPASFEPDQQPVVPDTPAELDERRDRPEPGAEVLETLRRAPRAIEPSREP